MKPASLGLDQVVSCRLTLMWRKVGLLSMAWNHASMFGYCGLRRSEKPL